MKLVLITGAGASRQLAKDGSVMPLMTDWSDALCAALDEEEDSLAAACHLEPGMNSETFEKNLGLLLRWRQVRDLEKRFQGLGGGQAGKHMQGIPKARANTNERLKTIMATLNRTLYDQFGQGNIDDERAASAYRALLASLGGPELVLATTNYDRSGEAALDALGHNIDTGFRHKAGRTPMLQPKGIVRDRLSATPLLHLHGAVGWYEKDNIVKDHNADEPFNPSLGAPVVLYPDPDKDPTSGAIVSQIWDEFRAALELADSVLVIGHSLHDPALVRTLKHTAKSKKVGISYLMPSEAERVNKLIDKAIPIHIDFGPQLVVDAQRLASLTE